MAAVPAGAAGATGVARAVFAAADGAGAPVTGVTGAGAGAVT